MRPLSVLRRPYTSARNRSRARTRCATPRSISDHSAAEYQVTLRNEGNTQAGYMLSAADDDHLLKYSFAQDQALLKPGQFVTVPLTVRVPRRLFGSDARHELGVPLT